MPSSLHARSTRSAISPRLAISILSNMEVRQQLHSMINQGSPYSTGWPSSTRIWMTLPERGAGIRIHRFHRFDDDQCIAGFHLAADFDEGPRAGRRAEIDGANHRRRDECPDAASRLNGNGRGGYSFRDRRDATGVVSATAAYWRFAPRG